MENIIEILLEAKKFNKEKMIEFDTEFYMDAIKKLDGLLASEPINVVALLLRAEIKLKFFHQEPFYSPEEILADFNRILVIDQNNKDTLHQLSYIEHYLEDILQSYN